MGRLTQEEIDELVKKDKNQATFNQTKALFKAKPLTSEEEDNPLKYYANNENFINNAPEKIIKGEKEKELSLNDELTKINSNISMLS